MDFRELGMDESIIQALEKEGIRKPAPIQELVFPVIMEGRNLAAQSETGSGKTLAYLLPIMKRLAGQEKGNKVLILVPTHELAVQVVRQANHLSGEALPDIHAVPIVGNVNIKRQIESLKAKPQIIVGTPGRILELIERRKIAAHLIQTVVIDEADKMLEKSQIDETRAVIKKCMRDVQKLFFSASIPAGTRRVLKEIVPDAVVIQTREQIKIPDTIRHMVLVCEQREKLKQLRSVISALNPKKAMVFINRAYDIEAAADKLKYHHYSAECIHGSQTKAERKKVIDRFRSGHIRILIGTDVAARGLHFDGVDVVIHYSIPENPKDYLHRAGRCGRNGRRGISISLVTEKELPRIQKCCREFGIQMEVCTMSRGALLPAQPRSPQKQAGRKNVRHRTKAGRTDRKN